MGPIITGSWHWMVKWEAWMWDSYIFSAKYIFTCFILTFWHVNVSTVSFCICPFLNCWILCFSITSKFGMLVWMLSFQFYFLPNLNPV